MNRFNYISKNFKGVSGPIILYIDGTIYNYIDVDANKLEGYHYISASCGCCSDTEDVDSTLEYELEYMHELDYNDLIQDLNKLKNIK